MTSIARTIETIVVGIERSTGAEAIVLLARKHDSTTIDTFGQHLGAVPKLDPGTFKLGDQAWVHDQGCIESRTDVSGGFHAQGTRERGAIIDEAADGWISKIRHEGIRSNTTDAAAVDSTSSVSGLDAWKRG